MGAIAYHLTKYFEDTGLTLACPIPAKQRHTPARRQRNGDDADRTLRGTHRDRAALSGRSQQSMQHWAGYLPLRSFVGDPPPVFLTDWRIDPIQSILFH
jgi:hypothetical protein